MTDSTDYPLLTRDCFYRLPLLTAKSSGRSLTRRVLNPSKHNTIIYCTTTFTITNTQYISHVQRREYNVLCRWRQSLQKFRVSIIYYRCIVFSRRARFQIFIQIMCIAVKHSDRHFFFKSDGRFYDDYFSIWSWYIYIQLNLNR